MFDIIFNDQVVIPNIDIFALVGKNRHLDVIISFNVTVEGATKELTIRGHPSKTVIGANPMLSFCVGECRLDKRYFWEIGNYIISAFSVIKISNVTVI